MSALAEILDNSLEACRDNHKSGQPQTLNLVIDVNTKTVQVLDNGKGFDPQIPHAAAQIGAGNGHELAPEINSYTDFFSARFIF